MKKILFIALAALFFISCEKSNINNYKSYIGFWKNSNGNLTRTLEVESNGDAIYKELTTSGNTAKEVYYKGRFILEGTTLKVGLKKLTINKEPTFENGIWVLTINNNEYAKW